MNKEEIDYWLRSFSNNNQSFMSKDGKIITLFKVFQELKELHYLLKIKNDYINELQQQNKKYQEVIDKVIEYIRIYRSYEKINNKDYLKGRDETGCLDINQVDELLDILKEVE